MKKKKVILPERDFTLEIAQELKFFEENIKSAMGIPAKYIQFTFSSKKKYNWRKL